MAPLSKSKSARRQKSSSLKSDRRFCAHCNALVDRKTERRHRKLFIIPHLAGGAAEMVDIFERTVSADEAESDLDRSDSKDSDRDEDVQADDAKMRDEGDDNNSYKPGKPDDALIANVTGHPIINVDPNLEPFNEDMDENLDGDADAEDECEENFGYLDSGAEEFDDVVDDCFGASDPLLSTWDQLGEQFEQETQLNAADLNPHDKDILRQYSLKVKHHLTDDAFRDFPNAFPSSDVPSLDAARPHHDLTACPYCKAPRFHSNGKARKHFTYLLLIPRLRGFFASTFMAKHMEYRAFEHQHIPGKIIDVFDSKQYRTLRLSTDGFAPFRHRKNITCWPLILFNYNLPPEIRFHIGNILSLGVIPGPKKPIDGDSFLWPAVEELLQLAVGVRAYDVLSSSLFLLRAYLILLFGDMPAMSLIMRMKGHNGFSPCRMCKITGLRVPGGRGTTHYVPLDRSNHPSVVDSRNAIKKYDPRNLPMQTHDEILAAARHVQSAQTAMEEERLSKACGIKGVSILSHLSSISLAQSFPYDFMHLIWENLVKNLVLLWTGSFKELDEGTGSYELGQSAWDAIGMATALTGTTILSSYTARPPNVANDQSTTTADSWSFWTLYIGPVLLRRRFRNSKYYTHFIELVKLLHLCLQFEISAEDLNAIREGFVKWVEKYESFYYQGSPARISACPVTIHALLHIADGIEACGPVWAYWAFPMERYCGLIRPAIKSRRRPFASLDRFVVESAQLAQITLLYNLTGSDDIFSRRVCSKVRGQFQDPSYKTCVLLPPKSDALTSAPLRNKIVKALATRYDKSDSLAMMKNWVNRSQIMEWGKVRIIDGDTISTAAFAGIGDDSRDSSYVRYEVLIDKHARRRGIAPEFEPQTFYARLQHIFVIQLPANTDLGFTTPETVILAALSPCKIDAEHGTLDIHYYSKENSTLDIVDIQCIQCVVGRIKDGSRWAIIDRSGSLARAIFDVS
ncbi:hypothetical protein EW146_g2190 [Bondarzewia mesenterica]|uniref:Transposase family Tnp2 protein n=1 Tax=Bondarzewia mesenterica TaxID=1095465 RepID=A0A4S4M1M4_9AGAM|nr:hypothetical protein EW146_g2190 [Bondarzewia mesenterica]